MNIDSDRIKRKEYHSAINPGLQKHSQEYRVLATLRFLFPGKYENMVLADCPDLQDRNSGIGVEVTSSVKNAEMQAARLFSYYVDGTDVERNNQKLNAMGYSVHNSEIVKSLVSPIETSYGEKVCFQSSIRRKQAKVTKYRKEFNQIELAILLPEIPSTDAEAHFVDWIQELQVENTKGFDSIIILSHRFCIVYSNETKANRKIPLSKEVELLLSKIGRMTAEGELTLSSFEWL